MAGAGNRENFSPQIIKQISKEIGDLVKTPLDGIRVMMNEEDITDIRATIDGPADTPYSGGLFHLKLVLTRNFPTEPPKGFFLTKIFHPNVAENGEICVNVLKRDWKPDMGLKNILMIIRCLLIEPNPESALNEEAGKLLLERYDDYSSRARLFTEIHARPRLLNKMSAASSSGPSTSSSSTGSSGHSTVSGGSFSSGSSLGGPSQKKQAMDTNSSIANIKSSSAALTSSTAKSSSQFSKSKKNLKRL